jgi:enoyl-CoA hydratase/carnithine racemase
MTESEPTVRQERHGAVLLITLNRPARLNAWTRRMQEAYFDTLEQADDDSAIRAIVVTGAGAGFCAGADLETLDRIGSGGFRPSPAEARPTSLPLAVRKPLIAAINGSCAGMGLIQALYCDVRFVAREARLTTAYAQRGLVAEHGISWLLPRIVGRGNALDLLLSARVISGEEAFELGLANWVCDAPDVVEAATAYAARLAERCSPAALAVIKEQVRAHEDVDLASALEQSRTAMVDSYTWPDLLEGVASFRERRAPRFPPLSRNSVRADPRSRPELPVRTKPKSVH